MTGSPGGSPPRDAGGRSMDLETYLRLDATALAKLTRAGAVRARTLVELAVARIEALDGPINAVTSRRVEAALAEAEALDRGPRPVGVFAGAPFLIKDLAYWTGGPCTFGCRQFARYRVGANEPSVAAALATGVIPLGRTSSGEFGLLATCEALLFGPTRNPWDLSRSVGGSSGGSAAAVAAGYAPMAFGGDGGGSLRIPASACGVVGFKPSRGRCPAPDRDTPGDLSVHFTLTRSVRDAARMLAAVERDPPDGPMQRAGFVAGPLRRRLRIGVQRVAITGQGPDPEVAAALDQAVRLCGDLGHELVEISPLATGDEPVERFLAYWSAVPARIERMLFFIRVITRRWLPLDEAFEPWTRGLADWHRRAAEKDPALIEAADAYFAAIAQRVRELHRRIDVVLSPVTRTAAPLIGEQAPTVPFETLMARTVVQVGYTPLLNAVGAPAISLPLFVTPDGRPIGVQFAGAPGGDATLIGLAYELEAAAPWEPRYAARRLALRPNAGFAGAPVALRAPTNS